MSNASKYVETDCINLYVNLSCITISNKRRLSIILVHIRMFLYKKNDRYMVEANLNLHLIYYTL